MIPVLYSYFRSSCSWRVRIALALKGVEYEYKAINLLKGEQKSDDYRSINSQGFVPLLVIDGQKLCQSLAIMEYLDEVYPEIHPLLPCKDPVKRSEVRAMALLIAADIQPVQNLSVLNFVGDEKKMDLAHWVIEKGFKDLEKLLEKHSGKYCYGDEITMVDLCLVPQVYNATRFKVDMSQFPIISRVNEELSQHPAFKVAHWTNQPDCPPELKV
ncbi:maleylacetoacetate isomerase isoform X1 [Hydra vulgaris]|uniref:maleylacetoacetate isomerase isoform X1 n=1 Tax=Hydra vulgaris TaxID=6087 RepID=UPI001F5F67E6|nr:maleylacetoacetate isomerase isoform X2 [Hydra vulgaris]